MPDITTIVQDIDDDLGLPDSFDQALADSEEGLLFDFPVSCDENYRAIEKQKIYK